MALTQPYERDRDSPSPAPQPAMTKRDVRRNRLAERLQSMIDGFNANQQQHYRAQLQAVQVDMNLILRADPYDGAPLEDGGEEIRALVEGMGAGLGRGGEGEDEAAQRDYFAMAGNRYRTFVREANDAVEKRDADLTALHNWYESSVSEVDRLTQQKIHQAEEEHKALANTIRQRLITTITKRRQQLLRDKEQLDIADSSALLLHPSQFSINNPGSPGGVGHNRKTRHLRHRAVSPGAADENGKRNKRKAAALEEDGNESPVPAFRPLPPPDNLGGGRSPFKDAREKNAYTQYEAPAYSLERLFTDKELALATDTAKLATYRYFHQPQQQQDSHTGTNGTAVPSLDDQLEAGVEGTDPDAEPTSPPAAAPEMERSTSHQVLTRGGARANPLAALSDLANVAAAASGGANGASSAAANLLLMRDNPFAPVVPNYHAVTRSEKSGAPAPPGVSNLDAESDFELMRRAGHSNSNPGTASASAHADAEDADIPVGLDVRNSLLDQALGVPLGSVQPFRLPLLETGPALIGRGVDRIPATGFAQVPTVAERARLQIGANVVRDGGGGALAQALRGGIGGEAMSRGSSKAGSEMGAEPPSGSGRRGRRLV